MNVKHLTIAELEKIIGSSEATYKFENKGFVSIQIDPTLKMSPDKILC